MTDKLEPCPHCGGGPAIDMDFQDDNAAAPRPHRVYIVSCCASIEVESPSWWSSSQAPPETPEDQAARAKAIELWNKRVPVATFTRELAETDWQPNDLQLVAVNVRHCRIPTLDLKRDAAAAALTLKAAILKAREFFPQ